MHLCDEIGSSFCLPVDEMCLITAIPLDEITVKLRQRLVDVSSNPDRVTAKQQLRPLYTTDLLAKEADDEDVETDARSSNVARAKEAKNKENVEPDAGSSQVARAQVLIDNGCVSHDPKLGTFTVIGSGGKPHVVQVFPSETCSCPSVTQCYHIIAVKISLGIPHQRQTKVNLTSLRMNTRNRSQKKSGRKRPRPGDYDVNPAPDSVIFSQVPQERKPSASIASIDHDMSPGPEVKMEGSYTTDNKDNVLQVKNSQQLYSCNYNFGDGDSQNAKKPKLPNTISTMPATEPLTSISTQISTTKRGGRCMKCTGCCAKDCGVCVNCKDMKRFGGLGKKKKACIKRACLATKGFYKQDHPPAPPIPINPTPVTVFAESVATAFLNSQDGRRRHRIIGDGNCLFRSFSYILYATQDKHLEMRALLTEFTNCNATYFPALCDPDTVQQHVQKMKKPCVWGTHVEIIALATALRIPVFVAVRKNPCEYYWAQYSAKEKDGEWVYPSCYPVLSTVLNHIEICHENFHYDVVVTSDGSIPHV